MTADEIVSKNTLLPGGYEVLRAAERRLCELVDVVGQPSSPDDVLAMDYAGIGDALCHDRLILQHLVVKQGKRVTWIATQKVGCLFKDDVLMRVLEGFSNPFRIPVHGQLALSHWLNVLFEERFPNWTKFNATHFVMSKYFGTHASNISDAFFKCCGVERDFFIKHSLRHLGLPPDDVKRPYLVLEYIGQSTGRSDPAQTQNLVANLSKMGISTVCVGPADGYLAPGATMRLGINLYDTFSILKGSMAMVGRSSGNQSLACFLPNLPVFEVDVNWHISHRECRLHPNTTTMGPDYPVQIPKLIVEKKLA